MRTTNLLLILNLHLEQSHAPSPKGEGWGEVGRTANFYHPPWLKPGTHLYSESDSKMIAEPGSLSSRREPVPIAQCIGTGVRQISQLQIGKDLRVGKGVNKSF
ncbi:hypothetical protein LZF95_21325 [Algoriphagus sp. AGSA1]|uniref:hypothetical protein n=1 Tax=Algoriphagus sp. AGSA1 TaxID=2907213 RepID=UPI001F1D1ECC|nr:hypothetical protein [Algoriphagus sp. AGSA1]MCE7057237.1 hypothetical protein [Algoriphagus sp. AGSA1]